jgi:hypothetical protein
MLAYSVSHDNYSPRLSQEIDKTFDHHFRITPPLDLCQMEIGTALGIAGIGVTLPALAEVISILPSHPSRKLNLEPGSCALR